MSGDFNVDEVSSDGDLIGVLLDLVFCVREADDRRRVAADLVNAVRTLQHSAKFFQITEKFENSSFSNANLENFESRLTA